MGYKVWYRELCDLLEDFNQEGKGLNGSLRKQEGFVAVISDSHFLRKECQHWGGGVLHLQPWLCLGILHMGSTLPK